MDERIKNALGIVAVLALIFLTISAWTWSSAFSRSAPAGATFSVIGEGRAVGLPDVAEFSFSILTQGGKDLAALQEENVTKANAAIDFVRSEGVEAKDIETQGYDIQPRYQSYDCSPRVIYQTSSSGSGGAEPAFVRPDIAVSAPAEPCPPADIVGYSVTQTVRVKVRDFAKTGTLLAGVTDRGANNVSGLNFIVDDPTALQNEARAKAIQDAQDQAEAMAEAGGFKLGRLVSVSESKGYYPEYRAFNIEMAADGIGGGAPAPTIEPGSEKITVQVNLLYEIR